MLNFSLQSEYTNRTLAISILTGNIGALNNSLASTIQNLQSVNNSLAIVNSSLSSTNSVLAVATGNIGVLNNTVNSVLTGNVAILTGNIGVLNSTLTNTIQNVQSVNISAISINNSLSNEIQRATTSELLLQSEIISTNNSFALYSASLTTTLTRVSIDTNTTCNLSYTGAIRFNINASNLEVCIAGLWAAR